MAASSLGANAAPAMLIAAAATIPAASPCTAAVAAPSGSFSPIRRATIAVIDIENPIATQTASIKIDSANPTVAMASAPRWATQNTSTMAKSDSITISRTIGIASSTMARPRLPSVKSCCDPRIASRIADQYLVDVDTGTVMVSRMARVEVYPTHVLIGASFPAEEDK